MNQLLHLLVHGASHAFQHYRHQQHRNKAEARQRAHGLSPFMGKVFDVCNEAGLDIREMEPELLTCLYRQRPICVGRSSDHVLCYAPTPFRFHSEMPRDVEEFLERRNSSLQYGYWTAPYIDEGYHALMLRVPVVPEIFNTATLQSVAIYAHEERDEVEDVLSRAGYRRSRA